MIDKVKEDLEAHGELHLVVEEHETVAGDEYIGLRSGNTEFHDDKELIEFNDGSTKHYLAYDRLVYYNIPTNFPD